MSDNNPPPQRMSALESAPGVLSMIRKGVAEAITLGKVVTYAAIGLVAWIAGAAVFGKPIYELIPLAITMLSTGPGLIALALGAKAWQAQAEAQGQ